MPKKLRTSEEQSQGWSFDQNLRNLFNPCTQIEMYMYIHENKTCQNRARSSPSGAGRVIKPGFHIITGIAEIARTAEKFVQQSQRLYGNQTSANWAIPTITAITIAGIEPGPISAIKAIEIRQKILMKITFSDPSDCSDRKLHMLHARIWRWLPFHAFGVLVLLEKMHLSAGLIFFSLVYSFKWLSREVNLPILLIQKHDCLCNELSKHYSNECTKMNCWINVADKFDMSPEDAEK